MGEFERSLDKVLIHEGGFSNNPRDPGGPTNKGVTQRVYDDYRNRMNLTPRSVKEIETVELQTIYRQSYWALVKGDQLPAGISYVVFDGAVNSGPKRSIMWLQKALGVVADGVIGPTTVAAAQQYAFKGHLVSLICAERLKFLKVLKTWPTFGKGWSRRVAEVEATGIEWAGSAVSMKVPEPTQTTPSTGDAKALVSDARPVPPVALADIATGLGAATAAVTQAQAQLAPYASIGVVAQISAYLTAAGVALALCGILYKAWATIRGDKIRAATGGDA